MAHHSTTTVTSLVGTCEKTILDAINRKTMLDTENPVVYNKLIRHYEDKAAQFYGDVDENYDLLLSKLEQDLNYA